MSYSYSEELPKMHTDGGSMNIRTFPTDRTAVDWGEKNLSEPFYIVCCLEKNAPHDQGWAVATIDGYIHGPRYTEWRAFCR